MINNEGVVQGGFTIRLNRDFLSDAQAKKEYDEYIGITKYEPLPK